MTRRELNYIGGLQHIRTEQYIEFALQEANPQEDEFRPHSVDLGLYRPLLRGEHNAITTEAQSDGDNHTVYLTCNDNLHAKATVQSKQGPTYRPPKNRPDDSIQETKEDHDRKPPRHRQPH